MLPVKCTQCGADPEFGKRGGTPVARCSNLDCSYNLDWLEYISWDEYLFHKRFEYKRKDNEQHS